MKSLLCSLLLAGSALLARAQSTAPTPLAPAATGTGKLTGTVVDAAGQPVPFATVALLDATTGQPLDGTACDQAGSFALAHLATSSYTLHVSFVGYQALDKTGLRFTAQGETLHLAPLTLTAAPAQLGEVVVQGQRA